LSLTPSQVERYHAEGFLAIERLVDDATVAMLRAAYDELLDGVAAPPFDRQLGGITRQIMHPSFRHPAFDVNPAVEAAREIVSELYPDRTVGRTFDMLIFKPPGHPHETPWHQDHSYTFRPVTRAGAAIPDGFVQFWLALDDADVENGCMHFLPGLHRAPLLEHVVASGNPDDDSRLLALRDPERQADLRRTVACPLPAGGCTLHDYGTPHYTPPNRSSDRPRRAYIFNLAAGEPDVATIEPSVRAHLRALAEGRA
jgi:ectoine hydroxylase-related dioxygenase (phytanoyl-CoA dioxygenase family)